MIKVERIYGAGLQVSFRIPETETPLTSLENHNIFNGDYSVTQTQDTLAEVARLLEIARDSRD